MDNVSLAVELRTGRGKGPARRLRADGRIPVILYGHGNEPTSLSLDSHSLNRLLKTSHAGLNTLFELQGAEGVSGKLVLIKALQHEPLRGGLVHADLYEINANERVVVNVPVHTTGVAAGTVTGGLVDYAHRELELECLVTAIPDELVVDITALEMGDSIHAREIELPKGVELKTDPELVLLSVVAPTKAVEEEVTEGEELAEGEEAAAEGDDAKADGDDEKKADD